MKPNGVHLQINKLEPICQTNVALYLNVCVYKYNFAEMLKIITFLKQLERTVYVLNVMLPLCADGLDDEQIANLRYIKDYVDGMRIWIRNH